MGVVVGPRFYVDQSSPLWDGLLAYYTADNTPNDSLGNYDGTLVNGATYGTGKINQGFSFDGVNDYFQATAPSHNYSLPTTYNIWVYPFDLLGQQFFIYLPQSTTGPGVGMLANKITFTAGSVNARATSTAIINSNVWQMITVVFKGNSFGTNNVDFYLNGVYNDSKTLNVNTLNNYTILNIGGSQFFNGVLDEVGIWNRVLTSTEVTELYNSGVGKQYPL
jgi:trimeric autotransporter adhesin